VSLFNLAGERLWTGGFHFSAFVYDVYCVAFQLKPGYDCDLLRGGRIIKRIGQLSDFVEAGSVVCFTVLWRLLDHSQSISFRQRKKNFVGISLSGRLCVWGSCEPWGHQVDILRGFVKPPSNLRDLKQICANDRAVAGIDINDRLVTWGSRSHGGDSVLVSSSLGNGVLSVHCTRSAFAAITLHGAVVAWGDEMYGGVIPPEKKDVLEGVVRLCGNQATFSAITEDGSLVTWGNPGHGAGLTARGFFFGKTVGQVIPTSEGFAALIEDGTVFCWGSYSYEPEPREDAPYDRPYCVAGPFGRGVIRIYSNSDGVLCVGNDGQLLFINEKDQVCTDPCGVIPGAVRVSPACNAFSVINSAGGLVAFGHPGLCSRRDTCYIQESLQNGVTEIVATSYSFAALMQDGSVKTWGVSDFGGSPSPNVELALSSDVITVVANCCAFAAIKEGGRVVTWGAPGAGGDSSAVTSLLASDVISIVATDFAFAAIRADRSVVTWGDASEGGDSTAIAEILSEGVRGVFAVGDCPVLVLQNDVL
jgi:hypothetical protein